MLEIENLVHRYSQFVNFNDELDKATYILTLEETVRLIKTIGYVDVDSLWYLFHLGIKLVQWIVRYKNISEHEAISLLRLEYVTYENFVSIFNHEMELLSETKE